MVHDPAGSQLTRSSRWHAALCGGALVLAAACEKASSPDQDSVITVRLTDPGTGPRSTIRFTPTKGTKQRMGMTITMSMSIDAAGQHIAPKLPTMFLAMDTEVTEVASNGDIRYSMVVAEATVRPTDGVLPQVSAGVENGLRQMRGAKGYAVVSSRGFTREGSLDLASSDPAAKQISDSINQSLKQISAPVPEEAVGLGATWETSSHATLNGLRTVQIASNKLVRRTDSTVELEVSVVQKAEPQRFDANGVSAELTRLRSGGSGTTTLDLKHVVPTFASMTMSNDSEFRADGQEAKMTMSAAISVTGTQP